MRNQNQNDLTLVRAVQDTSRLAREVLDLVKRARAGSLEHTLGLLAGSFVTEADHFLQREIMPCLPPVAQEVQPKLGIIKHSAFDEAKYPTLAGFGPHLWLVRVTTRYRSVSAYGVYARSTWRAYQVALAFYRSRCLNTKEEPNRDTSPAWIVSIHRVLEK